MKLTTIITPMPTSTPPKPFSLVHLQVIDVNTGAKLEFKFLPADVSIKQIDPAAHVCDWDYPVNDADSYIERMRQIAGRQYTVKIDGETGVGTEFIVHHPHNQNPK